jgi:hypothetical protein
MNNCLSPEERLNCDGQQFHQYQQNFNSLNTKRLQHNDIGNPGPDLGQAQKCCGVKLVNGIHFLEIKSFYKINILTLI